MSNVVARPLPRIAPHIPGHYWIDHPCDAPGCEKQGLFGFNCFLLKMKGGWWFCFEHRHLGDQE